MGWLYTQGTEGLKPPCTSYCPDIEPFAMSNGKLTPHLRERLFILGTLADSARV
ncbi:MAG: hypothetical protein LBD42_04585 [Desulfovibrio sp.]|jgi:hypothetical protein|nr:hypothetical protein [Desulfovibrio sp.]